MVFNTLESCCDGGFLSLHNAKAEQKETVTENLPLCPYASAILVFLKSSALPSSPGDIQGFGTLKLSMRRGLRTSSRSTLTWVWLCQNPDGAESGGWISILSYPPRLISPNSNNKLLNIRLPPSASKA